MKRLESCRLYAFVDTDYLEGRDPGAIARALCAGGADIIQLRAKGLTADIIRPMAEGIFEVAKDAGVRFVLNDHWEMGVELGVPIVHLGQEDFFGEGRFTYDQLQPHGQIDPKRRVGLGLSSHSPEQASLAVAAGADYIAVGPVYATPTKPGRPAVGLELVQWAAENVKIPWFAIGGVNLETLDDVLKAGATRVCVVSGILLEPDVRTACRAFRDRLPE